MSRKLMCLTSFVVMLSFCTRGWSRATAPSPEDGSVLESTWASLSWKPTEHAVSHDVYIGENYNDVDQGAQGTFRGNKVGAFMVIGFPGFPFPNGLVPGTTYYWRIDEVNDVHPDSPLKGDIWSFSIPPHTAHDPNPPDGAGFVDTSPILTWTAGFRARLQTVFFGDSFEQVSSAADGRPQANSTYDPGGLVVGKTYYWRVDSFGPPVWHKGDVWSFTVGAASPGPPEPVEGVVYVDAITGDDNNDGLTPATPVATIGKGIETANEGEIVLVHPGFYQEEVDFLGKAIVVQGVVANGAGAPVIHNPGDFAVSFSSGEGPDSIIQNFIIGDSFMGVFIAGSSPRISNVTVVGNKYGIEAYTASEPVITNCILWNNTDGDLFGAVAQFSCIQRGGADDITLDPLFADPENGDYHLRSERGRYWPEHDVWVLDTATSPCIDAGDPEADASGERMPNGGRINIGAYGGTSEASLSTAPPPLPLPGKASDPSPADGAVDVENPVQLTWTAGLNAVAHNVYLGTTLAQVTEANVDNSRGVLVSHNQPHLVFGAVDVQPNTIHYWRVDEVAGDGTIVTGDVWTFATVSAGPTPPPKGRACFLAETPVWANRVLVPISNAVSGQTVGGFGCDPATFRPARIEKVEVHEGAFVCRDIVLETGNRISVVDAHCFMLDSGKWIAAQNLRPGHQLKTMRGTVAISSVRTRAMPYVGTVYNLKIENSQKYAVGKDAVIARDY